MPHSDGGLTPGGGGACLAMVREHAAADEPLRCPVGHPDPPARPADSQQLCRCLLLVRREHGAEGRKHDVERGVVERERLRVALDELDLEPLGGGALPPMREQLGDVVDPHRLGEAPRRGERRVAAAAGDVEHPLDREHVDRLAEVLADHLGAIADLGEVPLRPDFLLYLGDGLEIRRCVGHLLPPLAAGGSLVPPFQHRGVPVDGRVVAATRRLTPSRPIRALIALALAVLIVASDGLPGAAAKMRSKLIDRHLCKTVHGGRFVPIPDFPGEKIDRRLLPDIHWMERRYDIFITDGYSTDPVHAGNGEHPIGLATDIVPNRAKGGTWNEIARPRTARRSRGRTTRSRPGAGSAGTAMPGHGRGNHLHLSWMHTPAKPGHPARVVYTRKCPTAPDEPPPPPDPEPKPVTGGTSPSGIRHRTGGPSGGVSPPRLPHRLAARLAPVVPEDL